jgi:hypothetical protein
MITSVSLTVTSEQVVLEHKRGCERNRSHNYQTGRGWYMEEMILLVFDGSYKFSSRSCVIREVEKHRSTVKMK